MNFIFGKVGNRPQNIDIFTVNLIDFECQVGIKISKFLKFTHLVQSESLVTSSKNEIMVSEG